MAVKKKKKKTGSPGKKGQKRSASSAGKQVLQDGTKTGRFDLTMLPLLAGIVLIFAVPFFWIRAAGYALFICAAGWWALTYYFELYSYLRVVNFGLYFVYRAGQFSVVKNRGVANWLNL